MVTGLSLGEVSKDAKESATTFISSSADKSVKLWVLTAVSYKDPEKELDHMLDMHENAFRCFDGITEICTTHEPVDLSGSRGNESYEFDHQQYYDLDSTIQDMDHRNIIG